MHKERAGLWTNPKWLHDLIRQQDITVCYEKNQPSVELVSSARGAYGWQAVCSPSLIHHHDGWVTVKNILSGLIETRWDFKRNLWPKKYNQIMDLQIVCCFQQILFCPKRWCWYYRNYNKNMLEAVDLIYLLLLLRYIIINFCTFPTCHHFAP